MLAILYLAGMIYFGDCICRYFFRFNSIQHRLATSFLVGLLLSSCITYLGSIVFAFTAQPLITGNIIFLGVLILTAVKMPRRPSSSYLNLVSLRPAGNGKWDWLCLGICFIFGCWLIFATLGFHDGNFLFGFKSWSDFGANLSLSQSFSVGHNFPTEHPFFAGETVRYHFLFWFQAANLSFLGLSLVWSVNLLSFLSLMALLILIMTFAELLFESRIVGRIAAILFFFASSSLSYIPFLWSKPDFGEAFSSIIKSTEFLDSGYAFRGENWGALSVSVFAYQRHLISGVGILFVVLVFVVDFYRHKKSLVSIEPSAIEESEVLPDDDNETLADEDGELLADEDDEIPTNDVSEDLSDEDEEILLTDDEDKEILLSDNDNEITTENDSEILLDGDDEEKNELLSNENYEITPDDDNETLLNEADETLPDNDEIPPDVEDEIVPEIREVLPTNDKRSFWQSLPDDFWVDIQPILFCGLLIGALPYWNSAIFASALIVLGSIFLFFPYRLYMATLVGTAVIIALPQVLMLKSGNIAQTGQSLFHWGYTMPNPSVLLILKYLVWTFGFKWLLIIIALWLLPKIYLRFFLALSVLLPVVFILQISTDAFNNHKLLNVWGIFGSIYAAYALWRIGKESVSRAILAVFLALAMVFGAIIDLFPVHNDADLVSPYENDRLTTWVSENTKTSDVFLTQTLLSHPILFAGRKIYFGNTLFAWTAGYDVGARELKYKQMFQERNPGELLRLLHENNIAYIGIDDGVRGNNFVKDNLNEAVYQQNFEKVFEDAEHRYANLTIYKVPVAESATTGGQ